MGCINQSSINDQNFWLEIGKALLYQTLSCLWESSITTQHKHYLVFLNLYREDVLFLSFADKGVNTPTDNKRRAKTRRGASVSSTAAGSCPEGRQTQYNKTHVCGFDWCSIFKDANLLSTRLFHRDKGLQQNDQHVKGWEFKQSNHWFDIQILWANIPILHQNSYLAFKLRWTVRPPPHHTKKKFFKSNKIF